MKEKVPKQNKNKNNNNTENKYSIQFLDVYIHGHIS